MIRLYVYDIKHRKDFFVDKDYTETIKTLKKYSYSKNIFVYDYELLDYYTQSMENQVSYWYSRQYRQIK